MNKKTGTVYIEQTSLGHSKYKSLKIMKKKASTVYFNQCKLEHQNTILSWEVV